MRLGVDFSAGTLLRTTVTKWKELGVSFAVLQYSERLPGYLSALASSGISLDVYVYLYFPLSPWQQLPEDRVRAALRMIASVPEAKVGTIWLDVEESTDDMSPSGQRNTVEALRRCIGVVERAGYKAGIYSGKWTYDAHTGGSTAFASYPLWHADYTSVAPVADLTKQPTSLQFRHGAYGGWTEPTIWQWHNTTMFGGHSVDLNIAEDLEPPPVLEEDDYMAAKHVTISAAERGSAPFRSYVISASGAGLKAAHVKSAEEFTALENNQELAGPLVEIPLAELMAFNPIPAPQSLG